MYSSTDGAVREAEHVFIRGNNLETRFKDLSSNSDFLIGEIGFGIGINFLTTCKYWLKNTKHNQRLEYYSFDKYLFEISHFREVFKGYPELQQCSKELQNNYPKNIQGVQKIYLFEGRVTLNLVLGNISEKYNYINTIKNIDAWYFDGFSPSKNSDLWSRELFNDVSETCHKHSTFSTYTSSGMVKKNLKDAGLNFNKVEGFSHKRHMLRGSYTSMQSVNQSIEQKIAIVGSGITGCLLSYMLAKKGFEVDLFEQSEDICSEASFHELLVTYPKLSAHDTSYGRFNLQSYLYATYFYESLKTEAWKKTGVLVLNHDDASNKRQSSLLEKRSDGEIYRYVNSREASEIAGIQLKMDGLFYKDAGYIVPREMCKFLTQSQKININTSSKVRELKRDGDLISFYVGEKKYEYQNVCLCSGSDTSKLFELKGFNFKRGQVTHIESNENICNINLPICAKGYISPLINNVQVLGSSYSDIDHTAVLDDEHRHNLRNLQLISDEKVKINSGRVGMRAVSRDHLPFVGEIDGVLINTAHGSRASISAPISAEIICSLLTSGAAPLEERELNSLSPSRFS